MEVGSKAFGPLRGELLLRSGYLQSLRKGQREGSRAATSSWSKVPPCVSAGWGGGGGLSVAGSERSGDLIQATFLLPLFPSLC